MPGDQHAVDLHSRCRDPLPAPLTATDPSCDGVDHDCDGRSHEYVPVAGLRCGYCQANSTPSSRASGGVEAACQPGSPLGERDASRDDVDDDCDRSGDEEYVPVGGCGVGYCQANSTPSSRASGGVEAACQPGSPLGEEDASCNDVDDDCDRSGDEEYVPVGGCGVGYCWADSTPSRSEPGGAESASQPGAALSSDDATDDGVDDVCDSAIHEAVVCDTTPQSFGPGG